MSTAIIQYMENQIGDGTTLRERSSDIKGALSKVDVTMVGFFDSEESPQFAIYKEAGRSFYTHHFFYPF